jgi:TP901 family phage tail tape measure protein
MATKLERLEFSIGVVAKQALGQIGKVQRAVTRLSNQAQNQFEKAGTGAMAAAGAGYSIAQAVAPAIDLNRALGEVASLDVDDSSLHALQGQAAQFAMQYGGSAADVVRASYDIQSAIAGLSGNELGRFTVASGVLAKATKADVGTITSYMGTMYGIFQKNADAMGKARWVEQIAGQTASAVKMFKTTGAEMSAAFTSLGANATAAGRGAAEQMAILGTLQATMSGSEAGTKYKAFLAGVGNAQKTLGMSFTDAQGNMLGMVDILEQLKGRFGDSLDVEEGDLLKKAFGSDEAVSLVKQLMANTDGLKKSIDGLEDVSGMAPAEKMAARMTDTWARLGGTTSTLGAMFGQVLLPPLADLADKGIAVMQTLAGWIETAPNVARWVGYLALTVMAMAGVMGLFSAATAIGKLAMLGFTGPLKLLTGGLGLLGKVMKVQTALQWLFNAALWANPVTWIIVGIIALIAVVGALIYWWDDLVAAFMNSTWGQNIMAVVHGIINLFSSLWNMWKQLVAAFMDSTWGKALVATIEMVMKPFQMLGSAWSWIKANVLREGEEQTAPPAAASAKAAPQAVRTVQQARPAAPPAGGLMQSTVNNSTTGGKQVTIGSVTIQSSEAMTPAALNEWAMMEAG